MIGYACILVLITERGLPFPAAKRLALCGGEEACPLPRCRGSAFVLGEGKCLALRCGLLSVAAHCGKEERVVDVDEMTRGRSALAVTFDQDVFLTSCIHVNFAFIGFQAPRLCLSCVGKRWDREQRLARSVGGIATCRRSGRKIFWMVKIMPRC